MSLGMQKPFDWSQVEPGLSKPQVSFDSILKCDVCVEQVPGTGQGSNGSKITTLGRKGLAMSRRARREEMLRKRYPTDAGLEEIKCEDGMGAGRKEKQEERP